MEPIITKLDALRQKYPDPEDQTLLNDWERTMKTALITANLQQHDAVKLIIAQYQKDLLTLNNILVSNPALFKDEEGRYLGLLIHEKKNWYIKFLKMFSSAQPLFDSINRNIDNKLNEDEN